MKHQVVNGQIVVTAVLLTTLLNGCVAGGYAPAGSGNQSSVDQTSPYITKNTYGSKGEGFIDLQLPINVISNAEVDYDRSLSIVNDIGDDQFSTPWQFLALDDAGTKLTLVYAVGNSCMTPVGVMISENSETVTLSAVANDKSEAVFTKGETCRQSMSMENGTVTLPSVLRGRKLVHADLTGAGIDMRGFLE